MKRRVELMGATALVTGAGSGIGRATAGALARAGAAVVCVDIDEVGAKTTAAACEDIGASSAVYVCDVADRAAMEQLAAEVHRAHGVLDVLVNNAGVGMSGRFGDMTLDDWEWIRSINLDGVVHGCHAFGTAMAERGRGHIVNVSSGLAFLPRSTEIAYCTTKAAVLMFSRSLRADWRRRGVGVSAVCPGVINTPILTRGRFVGPMWTPGTMRLAQRGFGWGHSPDVVATAVLDAIRRDRVMVTPGLESFLLWHLHKVLPLAVGDLIGRPPPRFLERRAKAERRGRQIGS
jgi:NAD(P)-dependent dehydrogenase (short-subunit alcohol dehydrogenase family)